MRATASTFRTSVLATSALFVFACSSSSNPTTPPVDGGGDGAATSTEAGSGAQDAGFDAVANSECGHPGDVGNSLGVGKFCTTFSDCSGNPKAILCTTLGSKIDFFCTFRCSAQGVQGECGENASCACDNGQCGCHPDACGGPIPPDDAGSSDSGSD